MKSVFRFVSWTFLALTLSLGALAQNVSKVSPPPRFFPVYDFRNDWLVYNQQYKNYVPFSEEIDEATPYVSLHVDLLKNRQYTLLLKTESECYLFLEGALQSKIDAEKWQELSVDSLFRLYKKDELLFTFYGRPGIGDKTVLLCNKKAKGDVGVTENSRSGFINMKPVSFSPFGNFAAVVLLIVLVVNAWLYNANTLSFLRLISPAEYFNNDPRDQLSKNHKPLSNTVITFVVVISMLMAFASTFLLMNRYNLFSFSTLLADKSSTAELLGDFSILSIVFFLLIYAKYICMVMAANMLNLDKQVDNIFIKIIQSSYLFYSFCFFMVFFLNFNHVNLTAEMRPYLALPFLLFYLARFITLYIITRPSGALINLYLFSYLCVIEIIPLIIGIKFAL